MQDDAVIEILVKNIIAQRQTYTGTSDIVPSAGLPVWP